MKREYRLSRSASRYLRHLAPATRQRIIRRLDQIAADPFGNDLAKDLHGLGELRASRVGDYRIVFYVDPEADFVAVVVIGPRGDIYGGL